MNGVNIFKLPINELNNEFLADRSFIERIILNKINRHLEFVFCFFFQVMNEIVTCSLFEQTYSSEVTAKKIVDN